jgi:hypothetical protein
MSLYDRLINGSPKIAVHQFMAALGEIERGKVTALQAANAFELSEAEQIEATELISKIVTPLEMVSIGGFVTLTNVGNTFDATNASQGLGMFRVQTAGITGFEFTVRVNKVGSGTQEWQLWDDTNSQEIALLSDSGAAGVKTLSVQQDLPAPLGASVRTIRVRARSTTASDDPIFLGACVLIQRVAKLSAEELHQILLLAEGGEAYTTVAALKARLGVS